MIAGNADPGPAFAETRSRIQDEIDHFDGALPERTALVWDGYIAALLEYSLVSVKAHRHLSDMLPKIVDNPVVDLFLGRHDDADQIVGASDLAQERPAELRKSDSVLRRIVVAIAGKVHER